MSILYVGIDLAKNVFAVHGVNEAGAAELRQPKVTRAKLRALPDERQAGQERTSRSKRRDEQSLDLRGECGLTIASIPVVVSPVRTLCTSSSQRPTWWSQPRFH
jgi:adenylyl- and sulfurtransferase ThiI